MALLTGGSATWSTSGSVLTVSGIDLTPVQANMTVSFVETDGSNVKYWRIQSVSPSGTSGGTITINGTLPTYSSSTGIVIDTMAFNGTGASLLNTLLVSVQNGIAAMLGAGFAADANSRVMVFAKATTGALAQIIFRIGSTAQFMLEQVAVSSVERFRLRRTADGTTWADVFSVRKDTGALDFASQVSFSGGFAGSLAAGVPLGRNKVINGEFAIAQRGTSFTNATAYLNSDDLYTLDRWNLLSDGNNIVNVTQSTDAPTGSPNAIRLEVVTANKKFGILQVIEGKDCAQLIGGNVALSFQAKTSNGALTRLRAAIITWSGTLDAVTSDVVSAWNDNANNPTMVTNWTIENTPVDLNITTSFARYTVTGTVDTANGKNIGVLIWSNETTTTVGHAVTISQVQLEEGTVFTSREVRPVAVEAFLCRRYFEVFGSFIIRANGGTTGVHQYFLPWAEPKRINPTCSNHVAPSYSNASSYNTFNPSVTGFEAYFSATTSAGYVFATVAADAEM